MLEKTFLKCSGPSQPRSYHCIPSHYRGERPGKKSPQHRSSARAETTPSLVEGKKMLIWNPEAPKT